MVEWLYQDERHPDDCDLVGRVHGHYVDAVRRDGCNTWSVLFANVRLIENLASRDEAKTWAEAHLSNAESAIRILADKAY